MKRPGTGEEGDRTLPAGGAPPLFFRSLRDFLRVLPGAAQRFWVLVIATGVAVWGLGQLSARKPAVKRPCAHRRRVARSVTTATTLVALLALALAILTPGTGPP